MFERMKELLQPYCEGFEIKAESDLSDDLKMVSMDVIEFIMDLEKEYKIRVPERKLGGLKTFQDYVNLIASLVK